MGGAARLPYFCPHYALLHPRLRFLDGIARVPHSRILPYRDQVYKKIGLMQRFPLFKIYSRPPAEQKRGHSLHLGSQSAVVTTKSEAMPGQIPEPSVTAGSLPSLGPLAGIPATTLTDKLKYGDLHEFGAMLSPLHFLDSLGKRSLMIKAERDEEEERRKRRREKNKVAAARCRNKKKERTDYLQKVTRVTKAQTLCNFHPSWPSSSSFPPQESERLEMLNSDLKAQIEELKLERQQLILLLNRHRPTCIVRTDSIKTPDGEGNPLLEQLEAK
ncbi:hypothetical protein fugu_016580 [Takifugu bimaculatus]|uniref:BZIP domain-containing protein n=1 Tax=Takifugu bimaculatus TaxID=433685 RepID=A0A4Z2BUJ5_9TELE|nr:hypothetical protein fugu_016580 [Takifugu bimaculatus]